MPTVVVTGASQGIGQAVAEAFAEEPDARLALISRSIPKLDAVAARCRAQGAEAAVFPCDVTDDAAVARTVRAILAQWGAPDVLVNNAGLFRPGTVAETPPDLFRRQVAVNLTSAFVVTQAFLGPMIARGRGHLFYMGSVASIRAYEGGAAYCVTKHGLLGLARVVREETKEKGLRVTTILAGATLTPSWEGVDLPEERFMPPEDIARAILDVYHLSDRTVVEEILLRPQLGDI
jgi:NAD(P)-dependent dehydrogenase (short-subunit alcohol dehydrogenase family)